MVENISKRCAVCIKDYLYPQKQRQKHGKGMNPEGILYDASDCKGWFEKA